MEPLGAVLVVAGGVIAFGALVSLAVVAVVGAGPRWHAGPRYHRGGVPGAPGAGPSQVAGRGRSEHAFALGRDLLGRTRGRRVAHGLGGARHLLAFVQGR
ncbi:MAG TPA: hypothetical protein VGO26_02560 [Amnibacterium sp.]|nr:hypothetical protein [Amnibacterium sp.]